ncbi:MAG: DUF4131 domain-containing protein [Firmicutes bacterium]|nr:DUF4131 domain-containing protein [Bacillota bacterium]
MSFRLSYMRHPLFIAGALFSAGIVLGWGALYRVSWSADLLLAYSLALSGVACAVAGVLCISPGRLYSASPEHLFGLVMVFLGIARLTLAEANLAGQDMALPFDLMMTAEARLLAEESASGKYRQAPAMIRWGSYRFKALIRWRNQDHEHAHGRKAETASRAGSPGRNGGPNPVDDARWKIAHGPILGYGDEVRVTGRLVRPLPARNPGGFDMRSYLKCQGITRVMYLNESPIPLPSSQPGSLHIAGKWRQEMNKGRGVKKYVDSIIKAVYGIRQKILICATRGVDSPQREMLSAILFGRGMTAAGNEAGLSGEMAEAFRAAGVTHIFSVSGLHVSLVVSAVSSAISPLGFKGVLRATVLLMVCLGYCIMSGMSASCIRAAIMAFGGVLGGQGNGNSINLLGLAALLILAGNPLLLFDVGFQLSFVTTAAIITMSGPICRYIRSSFPGPFKGLSSPIAVSIASQLGSWPIISRYFHQVSIAGIFSNLLILPLVEAVLISGMVSGVIGAFAPHLSLILNLGNSLILKAITLIIMGPFDWMGWGLVRWTIPPALLITHYVGLITITISYGTVKYRVYRFALNARLRKICLAVLAFGIIAAIIWHLAFYDRLRVIFISVGQGDSALIMAPGRRTMLIDGGNPEGEAVLSVLREYSISQLDVVVLTHPHEDHVGGLPAVLREVGADYIIDVGLPGDSPSYEEFLREARETGAKYMRARKGTRIKLGPRVEVDVLHPPERIPPHVSLNDGSMVLRLMHGKNSFLFAADIEEEGQRRLISEASDEQMLRSTVLKVAHHGGFSATNPEFFRAVMPTHSIISVGSNPFGHPSKWTIRALEDIKSRIYRTDISGAVIIESDGQKIREVRWSFGDIRLRH